MIKRILIANRGEIALRILRAARELQIECVAVYTQADTKLKHLDLADEVFRVRSYTAIDDIIMAAKISHCDAIHPGYGFLSENAAFFRSAASNDLLMIGPDVKQIELLEDKSKVRQLIASKGIQIIPGSDACLEHVDDARRWAKIIKYPVLMKAAFGGGGRGIRQINSEVDLEKGFGLASTEAEGNFGRPEIYLEKYFDQPRHIEVQLLGDGKGSVIHLGTRDCSMQRRHQKILEEAPAFGIPSVQLEELSILSAEVLSSLDFKGAATFEFLYHDHEFYFMEINARLQVEHPVTEMVTGIDIVKAQIVIAGGGELPLSQNEVKITGSAIECRINAEDEAFMPSPGIITEVDLPGGNGVRVDTHVYVNYEVPHAYDSLIGKLIVAGSSRAVAVNKIQGALSEFKIVGIQTSIPTLLNIVSQTEFAEGIYSTQFLDPRFKDSRYKEKGSA